MPKKVVLKMPWMTMQSCFTLKTKKAEGNPQITIASHDVTRNGKSIPHGIHPQSYPQFFTPLPSGFTGCI